MSLPDLDIDALRAFTAIVDSGGFTAAGGRLGRTQSAVSVKIKRLEAQLGRQLFERTSRSLSLTHAGATLLAYARRMLELNDESVRAITAPPVAGEMRVGISEYFQPREIAAMLALFAQRYPRAMLDVRIGLSRHLKQALAEGEIELAIGRIEGGERAPAFWREPLHWACGLEASFEADQPLPMVVLSAGCVLRDHALILLNKKKRPWRLAMTTSGMTGLLAALEAGLGVSILPASMLSPGLRVLGRDEGFPEPGEQQLAFYERKGAPAELTRAFKEVVNERVAVLMAARK